MSHRHSNPSIRAGHALLRVCTLAAVLAYWCAPAAGITVLWHSANTKITLNMPIGEMEFENPLTGTETVQGYKIVEWRDADYAAGPPPWYDDWTVSHPDAIDGNASEIWMRAAGHVIWTSTATPSDKVSIHMPGDFNDGLADVYVDGALVAQLDMLSGFFDRAFILVEDLPVGPHQIEIHDMGWGQGGTDVHAFGAAVLQSPEPELKWSQPPEPVTPENVFYGWNQFSEWCHGPIVADDWMCTADSPVTDIHWWGSFLDWDESYPPQLPTHFHIQFWTHVPPQFPGDFGHPGQVIHEVYCYNYTCQFAGWDFDPRTGEYEACFRFDQVLQPQEYFYQNVGANRYWVSIAACYDCQPPPPNPFGWKTRPQIMSPTPTDDAVVIFDPIAPVLGSVYVVGQPLFWPDPENSWDMAFELTTSGEQLKWQQFPDLEPTGLDVAATFNPQGAPPFILADDFLCTQTGPVTQIIVYGSWYHDMFPPPPQTVFTLSIHTDIPAWQSPTGYSMPGDPIWLREFRYPEYQVEPFMQELHEGWMTPPDMYDPFADTICWRYVFPLMPGEFFQQGTPEEPVVYWLDVQARVDDVPPDVKFGWKTSSLHWNDDAVWGIGLEPYFGPWNELRYPPGHPWYGQSIDLAFEILGEGAAGVKWSQPPMPYYPPNAYNGWDQFSNYGYALAADDWVCTAADPVTDIHWWGSFIGWRHPYPPPNLPRVFHVGIWTDVPADPTQPGSFSHPGVLLWENYCDDYTLDFVGWDFDPRSIDPGPQPPEATFYFTQNLGEAEWFWQEPGEHIYWLSIAALPCNCDGDLNGDGQINAGDLAVLSACLGLPATGPCARADLDCDRMIGPGDLAILQCLLGGAPPEQCCPNYEPWYPFGVKTRPRSDSAAPDDAVAVFEPAAPVLGDAYGSGEPLFYPTPAESWDLCFELTTIPQPPRDTVVCEPQGVVNNPFHPPTYWYDVTVGGNFGRCDFHVRVYDTDTTLYTNVVAPPTWLFAVHQLPNGEWWASWWDPDCDNPIWPGQTFRFQFDHRNPSTWGDWTTTISGTDDPYNQIVDLSGNHSSEPDGFGYRVHVPRPIRDSVVCEPQGSIGNPFHPPTYWYDVTPDTFGRCDFHVQVFDPNPANYTNVSLPAPTWTFAVHPTPDGSWWASWWDDPDCPNAIFNTFRFQFDHAGPSTWGIWTTTTSGTNDPYNQMIDQAANHSSEPDGFGYRVHVPLAPPQFAKWAQPPTIDPRYPEFFYGWNQLSLYWGPEYVGDDWRCWDDRPVSDVHWWGSYLNWGDIPAPPPDAPLAFHLGLWSDVPQSSGNPFSHPGLLLREWFVLRTELNERLVGFDFHPQYGVEGCFQYDFFLPFEDWFWQSGEQEIYWLSIAAVYGTACNGDFDGDGDVDQLDVDFFIQCVMLPPGGPDCWRADLNGDGSADFNDLGIMECQRQAGWPDPACCPFSPLPPEHPWGWKTRRPNWNDAAVRVGAPIPPRVGQWYEGGLPIVDSEGRWDMAFVLTTPEPCLICVGDLNCNGSVGFDDINPFVLRLSNPQAYFATYPYCPDANGDINGNGAVGFDDINPFVALLSNNPLPIPCP